MARKNISRVLSDGVVGLCVVVLLCTLTVSVQAQIEGQAVTYTISGSVGLSGVTMNGLPNTVTNENGYYTAVVKYEWSGTVTPVMAGYTFEPQKTPYSKVTSDQSNQDYIARLKTFTISGTARIDGTTMEGVVMEGLPGNPITGSDGKYKATVDYGWSGSATPMKDGYIFTPSDKPYATVTRNMTNQDYTGVLITFTISGSAGVEGVTMNGLPGNPKTGRNGTYSVMVKYNWSGTVKPAKEGHTFDPVDLPYTDVTSSYLNQDYAAIVDTFTISGTTGMDGVEMKGLPGAAVFTNEDGYYTASVDWGWSGSVKPVKAGYKFETATINYTKVKSDKVNQNYAPSPIILTISGSAGKEGVTMDGLPGNPVTGAGGLYSAKVDWGWTGTVTPMLDGYEFTPVDIPYDAITIDQKIRNYTAKEITFVISGSVGVIGGVTLKGLPGRPVMSNPDGTYSAVVKYGWKGTVTPEKAGYTFEPSEIQYPELYGPEVNRDYIAALLKRTISGTIRSDKGEPVEGIFLLADNDGGSATTNANGQYELTVDYGWRGMVTPTLLGYNFRPTNKRYAVSITKDQANLAFTAIVQMFTISHAVTVGGTPVVGVQVSANNGGGTAKTDSKGRFSVKVPYNWSGEIALSRPGFMFPSKPYANITEDYKDDMPVSQIPPPVRRATTPTVTPTGVEPGAIVPEGPEFVGVVPPAPTQVPVVEKPLTPLEQIQKTLDELLGKQREVITIVEPNEFVPEVTLISNVWADDDIVTVLQDIASLAGVTIIPDETVVAMVTCTLKDVPLETALDIVLGGTPYIWKKTPYYYLVCSGGIEDTMFSFVSETRRMKMNYITAEAAVGLLSTAFRDYVQAEIGPPGIDTYTVVVTAPPALMERIISDLKQIDHIRPAVLLDARIVVMERGNLLNLGVEWGFPGVSFGGFSNDLLGRGGPSMDFGGKMAWGLQIGYTPGVEFTNSLNLSLNLLAQNDEATIIANPQVLAQDGKIAEINVVTEEYFFMSEPIRTGSYYSYSELEKIESGTKLSITPHIGDNNDITLELAIEVSDSIPRGRESELPVVTRRTSRNTVRIKDGGTVALAGLTENRTHTDKRRVPGLSKLPLIGNLFKNTNDEKSTREIAVFVTATIIAEPGQSIDFIEPSTAAIRAPIRPMEGNFKMRLRDSLSRPTR